MDNALVDSSNAAGQSHPLSLSFSPSTSSVMVADGEGKERREANGDNGAEASGMEVKAKKRPWSEGAHEATDDDDAVDRTVKPEESQQSQSSGRIAISKENEQGGIISHKKVMVDLEESDERLQATCVILAADGAVAKDALGREDTPRTVATATSAVGTAREGEEEEEKNEEEKSGKEFVDENSITTIDHTISKKLDLPSANTNKDGDQVQEGIDGAIANDTAATANIEEDTTRNAKNIKSTTTNDKSSTNTHASNAPTLNDNNDIRDAEDTATQMVGRRKRVRKQSFLVQNDSSIANEPSRIHANDLAHSDATSALNTVNNNNLESLNGTNVTIASASNVAEQNATSHRSSRRGRKGKGIASGNNSALNDTEKHGSSKKVTIEDENAAHTTQGDMGADYFIHRGNISIFRGFKRHFFGVNKPSIFHQGNFASNEFQEQIGATIADNGASGSSIQENNNLAGNNHLQCEAPSLEEINHFVKPNDVAYSRQRIALGHLPLVFVANQPATKIALELKSWPCILQNVDRLREMEIDSINGLSKFSSLPNEIAAGNEMEGWENLSSLMKKCIQQEEKVIEKLDQLKHKAEEFASIKDKVVDSLKPLQSSKLYSSNFHQKQLAAFPAASGNDDDGDYTDDSSSDEMPLSPFIHADDEDDADNTDQSYDSDDDSDDDEDDDDISHEYGNRGESEDSNADEIEIDEEDG